MAVEKRELETLIRKSFPEAEIEITDLVGDKNHYQLKIASPTFQGQTRVQQHQRVYKALGSLMDQTLHALSVHTKTL